MMSAAKRSRVAWIVPAILSAAILALWMFPALWYTQGSGERVWFFERSEVNGWRFEAVPISEGAERALVADRTVNGEFRDASNAAVRVFSAKRYIENPNEIGLFVHTPDRCWVESGWKIEPVAPDTQELTLHGTRLTMERRVFQFGGSKELVYFCGLVDGQVLPYRLDHNLSVGMRTALKANQVTAGALGRASDTHFWQRLWTSFTSRRRLSGPKQFFRISTPLQRENIAEADARLQQFLGQWLVPGDYAQERASFKAVAKR